MNLKTLRSIRSIVRSASSSKIPVLSCFLINPEYLYYSDLEITVGVKHYFPVLKESPDICINAGLFIQRVQTMRAPYSILADETNFVKFINSDTETKIRGQEAKDFPMDIILKFDFSELFTLSGSEIRIMNIAKNFVADDELRPVMQCICLSQDHIVASDAHRLYYRKIYKKSELDVLFDEKVVRLMNLFPGSDFKISCKGDRFRAVSDDISIYWRSVQGISNNLVDSGHYPNWRSVVPKEGNKVIVPVNELIKAIEPLRFAINGAIIWRVICEVSGNFMDIIANNRDSEIFAKEKINIFNKDNLQIRFAMKSQFLLSVLKIFRDEGRPQVTMQFTDSSHCFVFADMMLLMPVMINDEYQI